jgi:hypothetical protein
MIEMLLGTPSLQFAPTTNIKNQIWGGGSIPPNPPLPLTAAATQGLYGVSRRGVIAGSCMVFSIRELYDVSRCGGKYVVFH